MAYGFALLLSFTNIAYADLPPPPGYVEQCTVEKQQRAGTICEPCNTYHAKREACVEKYQGTKFSKACQTAGASTWTEIWCKADKSGKTTKAVEKAAPAQVEKKSCQSAPGASLSMLVLALFGAFLIRRPRHEKALHR